MNKKKKGISFDDFVAYRGMHNYIFLPSREPWPASSVDAQLPPQAMVDDKGKPVLDKKTGKPIFISAHQWLDKHRPVHQMTWAPGLPPFIHDKVVSAGGWIDKPGVICLNLYIPPTLKHGDARKAKPWLDHVRKVYPTDADHIIFYLAHRVQRPGDKINHGLFLGGAQGVGKDSLLEPVKHAVGPWNFAEVSPVELLGRFNGFRKSVILRESEARDLGESNRFAAYEHTKTLCAAPPDTLRVDEKNLREHYVMNCCGVIFTSNYKTDGIYLPADDRRTYVAWSELTKEDFSPKYWKTLWGWYAKGGIGHVAAYLAALDISAFDFKAPPPKTAAFWEIVDANRAPELSELADVLDKMENPKATTLAAIMASASGNGSDIYEWLDDRKNRRSIPHRLELCGYTPVRNDGAGDGLWKVNGARQVIYSRSELSLRDRFKEASKLIKVTEKMAEEKKGVVLQGQWRRPPLQGGGRSGKSV